MAVARPVAVGPVGIGPLRSLLERFRRSAGVPAAVVGELSAELAPVFAVLDEVEREAAELRELAEEAAAGRLQEADELAERILAEGRRLAALRRDEELRSVLREADADAEAIVRRAQAKAEALRRRGDERLPGLVAEVVARVQESAK